MAKTVVLATVGSYGDLHPYMAAALALKRRGVRVVKRTTSDEVIAALGRGLQVILSGNGGPGAARRGVIRKGPNSAFPMRVSRVELHS